MSIDRVPELALALALGYAGWQLASGTADVVVGVIGEHAGGIAGIDKNVLTHAETFSYAPYALNFHVGKTVVVYGPALSSLLALGLVGLVAVAVVRRRSRVFEACPFCVAQTPIGAHRCAMCGSTLEPVES